MYNAVRTPKKSLLCTRKILFTCSDAGNSLFGHVCPICLFLSYHYWTPPTWNILWPFLCILMALVKPVFIILPCNFVLTTCTGLSLNHRSHTQCYLSQRLQTGFQVQVLGLGRGFKQPFAQHLYWTDQHSKEWCPFSWFFLLFVCFGGFLCLMSKHTGTHLLFLIVICLLIFPPPNFGA